MADATRSLGETIKHYQTLRNDSYEYVCKDYVRTIVSGSIDLNKIKLCAINIQTLTMQAKEWEFSWPSIAQKYLKHPRRFEVSIWYDQKLCGLAFGKTSKGSSKVRIDIVEGGGEHPLKGYIYPITFECALAYAMNIGRESVVIKDPRDVLVAYYMKEYPRFMTHYPSGVRDFQFHHIHFDINKLLESE